MQKNYLRLMGATVFCVSLIVYGFIAWADPYRLSGWHVSTKKNDLKPRPSMYLNEVKMANFLASSSNALILGNSRADIGFDPEYKLWSDLSMNAYNLAIPGTGIATTQAQIAQILTAEKNIRFAVVGLDFLDFLIQPEPAMDAGLAFEPPEQGGFTDWRWRINTAFSITALSDAVRSLLITHKQDPAVITAKGANPLFDYRAAARKEGYYAIFRQRAQENAKNYSSRPKAIIHSDGKISRQLATLESILDELASNEIEVALTIYPYHAQILAMWDELGLTPPFLQWKVELVRLVDRVKQRYPKAQVRLWDFSGFHSYACEPIPPKADLTSETKWYWESGHFKKELGNLILDKIISSNPDHIALKDANFGFLLNTNSLAYAPIQMDKERTACREIQPALFSEVTQLLARAR